jgi:hypothetical protein
MLTDCQIATLRQALGAMAEADCPAVLPLAQLRALRDKVPALYDEVNLVRVVHYPRISRWRDKRPKGRAREGKFGFDPDMFRFPATSPTGAVRVAPVAKSDKLAGMGPIDQQAERAAVAITAITLATREALALIRECSQWAQTSTDARILASAGRRKRSACTSQTSEFVGTDDTRAADEAVRKAHRNQRASLRRAMARINAHIAARLRGEASAYRFDPELCTAEDRKRRAQEKARRAIDVIRAQLARMADTPAQRKALELLAAI